VHQGSKETFEFIADWIAPDFFYSKKDVWHRFGMLGVFGDYVLSCTQGDVLEIGCGESSIYLGHLAKKWNRRSFHCDIAPDKILNPLTVPGYMPQGDHIISPNIHSSTAQHVLFSGSSVELFEKMEITPLALSFIDGDHTYEQASLDFWNCVQLLMVISFYMTHILLMKRILLSQDVERYINCVN
jgi:hypothetical protein